MNNILKKQWKALTGIALTLMIAIPTLAGMRALNSSGSTLGIFESIKCGASLSCSNSSEKLLVEVSGVLTGDLSGDGGDQFVGYLQNQVAASTTALTAAQCGSTIVSAGAAVQPLPEASTVLGCRYTFVCGTADDLDIDPADATDSFSVINSVAGGTGAAITPSAGDEIRCTDIGSSITIEAVGANLWAVIGVANGAWTDVN
jgi:hypothetical protein